MSEQKQDLRDAVIQLADALNSALAAIGNLDPGRNLDVEYEWVADARRIAMTVEAPHA